MTSLEKETIQTMKLFMNQAETALNDLRFTDFQELMESFFMEGFYLEEKSFNEDEDYIERYAVELSQLYFMYGYGEFLVEKSRILIQKIMGGEEVPFEGIGVLIVQCFDQSFDFTMYLPDSQHGPDGLDGSRKFYDDMYATIMEDLKFFHAMDGRKLL